MSHSAPRVLLVNASSRRIAGIETYLEDLLREFSRRGIPAALLSESDEPRERQAIALGADNVAFRSPEAAEAWKPNVVLANGRFRPDWETRLCARFPAVYFAHNFYGTCISGLKRHLYPKPEPCFRKLGPACLGLYLPRGCGGRNPVTMFRLYGQEQAHRQRLNGYRLIVTHSENMRAEYVRQGIAEERIRVIPFCCFPATRWPQAEPAALLPGTGAVRGLFAGRMEAVKGGAEFIEAAESWAATTNREIQLTMAGDGPHRSEWEQKAHALEIRQSKLRVHFPGWLDAAALQEAFATHHFFAMPSLWPEPFGKGGIEAGCWGCPSIGFAIGGIPQWLVEGRNGHLADWHGEAAPNLAKAMEKMFSSEDHYRSLRAGAWRQAESFSDRAHVDALLPLLEDAARLTPLSS